MSMSMSTALHLSPSTRLFLPLPPSSSPALRSSLLLSPRSFASRGVNGQKSRRSLAVRCDASPLADLAPATSAAYGALLLGGGVFAYARSRSKGSILGGLSGGALMAAAYYLMQSPETKEIGEAIGFGSAFIFSSVFGIRLAATRKLIPSGLLLGVSVGALAVFLSAYMQAKV